MMCALFIWTCGSLVQLMKPEMACDEGSSYLFFCGVALGILFSSTSRQVYSVAQYRPFSGMRYLCSLSGSPDRTVWNLTFHLQQLLLHLRLSLKKTNQSSSPEKLLTLLLGQVYSPAPSTDCP